MICQRILFHNKAQMIFVGICFGFCFCLFFNVEQHELKVKAAAILQEERYLFKIPDTPWTCALWKPRNCTSGSVNFLSVHGFHTVTHTILRLHSQMQIILRILATRHFSSVIENLRLLTDHCPNSIRDSEKWSAVIRHIPCFWRGILEMQLQLV